MSTWKIDPAHTDALFSAKHMMVTTVRGKFHEVEGTLEIDEDAPTRSRGEFRVAAASLNTGVAPRDQHLRSADFFDVEREPWITFTSTSVEHVRDDDYKVTGDLTIRGTTRPVTFDVTLGGIAQGMRGGRHLGLSATTRIDREDWGLNWNMALEAGGWLVGKEIKVEVEVAADEVASDQAAARADAEPAAVAS
ncbi:MAG TPA: YceI family protein [Candidatus Dormibacteraeota bacterium]|nr:YceI family protein [Candidatus Dormibacteraeota bacterium]